MNVYDSERMAGVLGADDFEITGDEKSAEYVIINTCSVRQHAEDRALSYIGAAIKDKKVIVAGCMAERMQDELMAKFPRLHAVVGTFNFSNIVSAINRGKKKIFAGITEEKYPVKLRRNEKVRGYITIMQGCDNYCAYCIVPYVRGRERSRDVEGILAEIRQLASDGFKEVMFLGQNVNSFLDAKSGINFSGLLRKSAEISGIERLRFMTSHPKDLTDELIESIAAAPKVCKHIHLPLQSGSDRILKMMNRHYTADWYLSRVRKIREAMPGGAITTDILVGFPGETDVDFQQTLEVMKKAGFDASYIFKYSPRRGTKAALMDSQVDEKEKLKRLNNVLELQKKISEDITKAYVGREVKILVTGPNMVIKTMMEGITDNSKKVIIPGDTGMIGNFYRVKVTRAQTAVMEGEIIK
jgi:tRNA-2-methylthio-N6-dimethylallyladenosine synthase